MPLIASWKPYTLHFNFEARTSRGAIENRTIYLISIEEPEYPEKLGLGEAAPLDGLSPDCQADIPSALSALCRNFNRLEFNGQQKELMEFVESIDNYLPAVKFGWEMACLDFLNGGTRTYFKNDFLTGNLTLPINGLIWMGSYDFMKTQVDEKLAQGFDCIKIKIGALDFNTECNLLSYIRDNYSPDIVLRVDANGAFAPEQVMEKLRLLEQYNLHSIEQPLAPGQITLMRSLCDAGSVPVGLDEELIGIYTLSKKNQLLDKIQPQYLILKPTLLGGFQSTREWIELAEDRGIGWWITSALESNVGLNALAQFTSSLKYIGHQGLGTGQLFFNNFDNGLLIKNGHLLWSTSPG